MAQSSSDGSIMSQIEELVELIANKLTVLETKTNKKLDSYLTLIKEVLENLGGEMMMPDEEQTNNNEEENGAEVGTITAATSSVIDTTISSNGAAENGILSTVTADTIPAASSELEGSDHGASESEHDVKDAALQAKLKQIEDTCDEYEKALLGNVILPSTITTTFDDVKLPPSSINSVRTLMTLALVRPTAFTYGVLASNKILGLLLYGPPGTGKTHLARAVAKDCGITMLTISGAEIFAKWAGESEKNIRAIFSLSKKLDPCVIFIDEADSVFRARGDVEWHHHREVVNQFLKEWDGITSNKSHSGFLMLATNRPYDLDEAVIRRLPRRILVDMPTNEDREEILKSFLKDEVLALDVKLSELSAEARNFTGSDLKNLCVAAAFACEYEQIETLEEESEGQYPQKRQKLTETSNKKAARRTLHLRHFEKAKQEITPSVDVKNIIKIREFDRLFNDKERPSERKKDDAIESRIDSIDGAKYWPRGDSYLYHGTQKRLNLPS